MMEEGSFDITVNDRGIRAMKQAIDYTLEKWTGQEDIDQEALMELRPVLQPHAFGSGIQ